MTSTYNKKPNASALRIQSRSVNNSFNVSSFDHFKQTDVFMVLEAQVSRIRLMSSLSFQIFIDNFILCVI